MARYCGDRNSFQLILNVSEFKEACLIQEGSLFTNHAVWTASTCEELIHHFVNNLDEGKGDFYEKLEVQLTNTSAEAKVLASEMLWLMFLCPSNMGPTSKRMNIERVFSWSGFEIDTASREKYLSDLALTGIGSAGTAYNTGRWRELVYVIRLVESLLKLSKLERASLLSDPMELPSWLEAIPENGSRQFRHMLLYLLFPETQERIFGNTDRRTILTTLTDMTRAQYNRTDTKDIDSRLLELRQSLEAEFGTQELDYYVEPLSSKWRQRDDTYPNEIHDPGLDYKVKDSKKNHALNTILYGPPGTGKTYSTINRALDIVDPDFYGKNKDDRIAIKKRFDELLNTNRIGFVTFHQSFSYEDFVEGLKASTENNQVNYDIEDGIFKRLCESSRAKVTNKAVQDYVDISGRKIWKMSLGDIAGDDAFIYQQCIDNGYVLLGYGFDIDFSDAHNRKQVAQTYRNNQIEIENESNSYQVTSVNKFKNEMSIGDLIVISDGNRKFRAIAEITSEYYFDGSLVVDAGYSQVRKVIWHRVYEPSLPVDELFKKNLSQMTLYRLYDSTIDTDKLRLIMQGRDDSACIAPGRTVGKYYIESISDELIVFRKPNGSELPMPKVIVDELCQLVRSEDISVEDIKQKRVFDKVDTSLERYLVNGYPNVLAPLVEDILKKGISFTNQASTDKRVLIIDEINRGNISNIFGELITLIEPSKREGGEEALSVKLPYSKEPFSVPANLHIIGTMNTADKSLAQLDIALRRRFKFEEMMTNYELLSEIPLIEGVNIERMVRIINKRIELLYDREHTIGHSFFLPLKESPSIEKLAEIFNLEILPLLEEYFFEDWHRVAMTLGDHLKTDDDLRFIVEQFDIDEITQLMGDEWEPSGVRAYVRNNQALMSPDAYIGIYS
ncbi:AAA family ATPase [Photobacterium sp. CCB-ST2H9]|uniref:AAA family ATPase n=1 Tax=Photobacterium sp. CCB-ST2H9 TaxID=2912855 RepID=UPI002002EE7B|nr:AAA family ATPase [Photobacterium sp. CCB-ST2H9]UTM56694.1 AAA family ATPase [Photobacterium sp. CCB-ST2H9]